MQTSSPSCDLTSSSSFVPDPTHLADVGTSSLERSPLPPHPSPPPPLLTLHLSHSAPLERYRVNSKPRREQRPLPRPPPKAQLIKRVAPPSPLPPLRTVGSGLELSFTYTSSSTLSVQLQHLLDRDPAPASNTLKSPPILPPINSNSESMASSSSKPARPPLPTPPSLPSPSFPSQPNRLPYPNSYGPSSTIRPAQQNAHEAFKRAGYGGVGADEWIPYMKPTPSSNVGRGSTFFVGGNKGTARLAQASKRPPLPTPPMVVPSPNQPSPQFQAHTAYSPPTSPQALPPGAMPPFFPPSATASPTNGRAPPMSAETRVPLVNSSAIMVHSGFWQILQATGSRFLNPNQTQTQYSVSPAHESDIFDGVDLGYLGVRAPGDYSGQVNMPGRMPQDSAISGGNRSPGGGPKKKRLSVDMIGKPGGFTHLAHASDFDQAADILKSWNAEGRGKLADPAWVQPIKEAARARARARGIAEVQANRDEEVDPGSLKVVNGVPSTLSTAASSVGAVEDEVSSPTSPYLPVLHEDLVPPSFPSMSRTNSGDSIVSRGGGGGGANANMVGTTRMNNIARPRAPIDGLPTTPTTSGPTFDPMDPSTVDFALPTNFLPSLTTIEKAVATKIYLEQHYHAILRKPRDRDTRKALLEKELALLNISDTERRNVREAWKLSETEYLRDIRNKVNVGSFVKLKILGRGAFGVISLVKERGSGKLYAMKQLRKGDMLRKGQEGHVRAERDLLAVASSATRWAVQLAYSFQDVDHLYLVMTFMGGGDLLTMLIEKDTFDENTARFYFAEMVLAVEETHRVLGAIHRDIKPDNFLFSNTGHLLISDYGLATDFHWAHDGQYYENQRAEMLRKYGLDLKDGAVAPATQRFDQDTVQGLDETPGSILTWRDRNRRRLAYSVVGTNNYMACEVIRGTGYDQACDWWSLGIILYECLCGFPPFVSKSRQATRQKILNWRTSLKFPAKPRLSHEAIDLISRLICEKEVRLGSRGTASASRPNFLLVQGRSGFQNNWSAYDPMQTGAEEIKAHPFFKGIDWERIHLQTPPFVPQLSHPEDTRYFDQDIEAEPLPAPDAVPGAPDTTRDPLLRHPVEGEKLLETRKQLAFQGWTFKQKRQNPRTGVAGLGKKESQLSGLDEFTRGRSAIRSEGGSGFMRSLSI